MALMHLVSELCDAGELSQKELAKHLLFYDHTIDVAVDEVSMPNQIQPLSMEESSYLTKEWVKQPSHSKRLFKELIQFEPGWHIIGEHSLQRSLNWGLASETYFMNLVYEGQQDPEHKHEIFGYVFNKTIETYYDPSGSPGMPHIMVINDHRLLNYDLKANWIAFNPNLALYLGWVPNHEFPFGWQNEHGELMARSIFWRSANINLDPPKLESEAGEGWLVIVSEKAIDYLLTQDDSFVVEERVKREKNEEGISTSQYNLLTNFRFPARQPDV
jgi:hypothetical protein